MKIQMKYKKIVLGCSKDEFRPAMQGVFLKDGRLTVTDAFRLVSIPVKIEDNEKELNERGGVIPRSIIKAAFKAAAKMNEAEINFVEDGFQIGSIIYKEKFIDEKFPPFESIFIEAQERLKNIGIKEVSKRISKSGISELYLQGTLLLGLNIKYLYELSQIIPDESGENGIVLALSIEARDGIFRTSHPIFVNSREPDKSAMAMLMPTKVHCDLDDFSNFKKNSKRGLK